MELDIREIIYNFMISATFIFVLFGIALVVEEVVQWLDKN